MMGLFISVLADNSSNIALLGLTWNNNTRERGARAEDNQQRDKQRETANARTNCIIILSSCMHYAEIRRGASSEFSPQSPAGVLVAAHKS